MLRYAPISNQLVEKPHHHPWDHCRWVSLWFLNSEVLCVRIRCYGFIISWKVFSWHISFCKVFPLQICLPAIFSPRSERRGTYKGDREIPLLYVMFLLYIFSLLHILFTMIWKRKRKGSYIPYLFVYISYGGRQGQTMKNYAK